LKIPCPEKISTIPRTTKPKTRSNVRKDNATNCSASSGDFGRAMANSKRKEEKESKIEVQAVKKEKTANSVGS
jgi:hypothetical protein